MTDAAPYAAELTSAGSADPRSLVLHLEVCRLQAELERLEARLGDLRSGSTAGQGSSPLLASRDAELADELLDRMVATLLESGRVEIADVTASRHAAAEAGLDADRARADAIVDAARSDLEAALAERGGALRTTWARGLDEVDLVEDERPSAPLVSADPVTIAPPASEPFGSEQEPSGGTPAEAEPVSMAPALPRTAEVEEARTDAAFDAWMAVGPGGLVADAPDAALDDVVVAAPSSSDLVPDTEPTSTGSPHRARSRWLLPLEVVGALLAAAILVVLVLVLVG